MRNEQLIKRIETTSKKRGIEKNYISENTFVFLLYHAVSSKLSLTTFSGKGWIFWNNGIVQGMYPKIYGRVFEYR